MLARFCDEVIIMSGSGRNALIICASVLAIAALYFARSVFAPAAVSLFAVAVVWPVQKWLEERLPQLIALAITLLLTVFVLSALLARNARTPQAAASSTPRAQSRRSSGSSRTCHAEWRSAVRAARFRVGNAPKNRHPRQARLAMRTGIDFAAGTLLPSAKCQRGSSGLHSG